MNSSAYYLGEILEMYVHRTIDLQKELQKKKKPKKDIGYELDQGILAGYYIVIGKLFNAVASLGVFSALPKDLQGDITPLSLVEDLKKGNLNHILLLDKFFMKTSKYVTYGELNLKALLEELISEGLLLKNNLQSHFDEGKMLAYAWIVDWLYDQAEFFIPQLFKALPNKLRNFVPESIAYASYKE